MKRWQRWTLGIVGVLVLALAVIVISNWSTIQILKGTEGVSGVQAAIPDPAPAVAPASVGPHDWSAWRGARNDGRSTLTGIRTDWSGGLRKLWEVDYLCQGRASASWAAPVVRGNRLVVPGRDEKRDLVFGLDPETGDLLWLGSYEAPAGKTHGPGARATPYIDGMLAYTFGRDGDLACWNIEDGSELWRTNVRDQGGEEPRWGFSSSPLVLGDRVFVQAGGSAQEQSPAAGPVEEVMRQQCEAVGDEASAGGTGGAFAPVGGTVLSYSAPVANDAVTVSFQQAIGANDALRTGAYSKTLTFTLSTTSP